MLSSSLSLFTGGRTTVWTICQDDFYGTKWRLVRIWKSRTETSVLNKTDRGSKWTIGEKWEGEKNKTGFCQHPSKLPPPQTATHPHTLTISAFIPVLWPELSPLLLPHSHLEKKYNWFRLEWWLKTAQCQCSNSLTIPVDLLTLYVLYVVLVSFLVECRYRTINQTWVTGTTGENREVWLWGDVRR